VEHRIRIGFEDSRPWSLQRLSDRTFRSALSTGPAGCIP
jgi:hypothetical protein